MRIKTKTLTIESLHLDGYGVARDDEMEYRIWNALPGETVSADLFKRKRGVRIGTASEIIEASEHRIKPKDDAFISTSPWQIMDFDFESQQKLRLTNQLFTDAGLNTEAESIYTDTNRFGYRNKMEFGLYEDEGVFSLSFFKRARKGKIPVDGSSLASDSINDVAQKLIERINASSINGRPFKSLIVRSNRAGQVMAGLFVTEDISLDLAELPNNLVGVSIINSDTRSPASVVTNELETQGSLSLTESINGTTLNYGLHSFFQVNISVFEAALADIALEIDTERLTDFYAGTGALSIPIHDKVKQAVLVDSNEESIEYATHTISKLGLSGYKAVCSPAEKVVEYIPTDHILMLDPPRAGLHKDVIKEILEKLPPKIVYLSCNPQTQADDIAQLLQKYKITKTKLYNFFPATPHVESLIVLERS